MGDDAVDAAVDVNEGVEAAGAGRVVVRWNPIGVLGYRGGLNASHRLCPGRCLHRGLPQERLFCEDGRFDAALTFRRDGFVIDFDRDNVIPYEDRAFEDCTFVEGLLFGDGEVTDDQFPKLEVLGAMLSNQFDEVADTDELVPDDLVGFDTVTDLGKVRGLRTVSGFSGVIRANDLQVHFPMGFRALEEVGEMNVSQTDGLIALRKAGNLTVATVATSSDPDVVLPSLTEVVGSLIIGTLAARISTPKIRSIGNNFQISGPNLESLVDLQHQEGADVGGLMLLQFNSRNTEPPLDDEYSDERIDRSSDRRTTPVVI